MRKKLVGAAIAAGVVVAGLAADPAAASASYTYGHNATNNHGWAVRKSDGAIVAEVGLTPYDGGTLIDVYDTGDDGNAVAALVAPDDGSGRVLHYPAGGYSHATDYIIYYKTRYIQLKVGTEIVGTLTRP